MTAAELKASILDRAVKGELTAAWRTSHPAPPSSRPSSPASRLSSTPIDAPPYELPPGWVWKRLGEVTSNFGQKTPDKTFCYIDVGSIDNVVGRLSGNENIVTPDKAPSRAKKIVRRGCVLYSCVRPYLLNVCVVDRDFSYDAIASTAFAVLNPCDALLNKFLFYYLRSPVFIDYTKSVATGQAYPAISDANFYKGLIPLPPLAEQHEIVAKIEELMPLVEEYGKAESELAALNDNFPAALKKSILQHAVEGRLTARWRSEVEVEESAAELLSQIAAEKKRLIAAGKIKKTPALRSIGKGGKPLPPITDDEKPFPIPESWAWVRLGEISSKIGAGATPKGGANVYVPHGVKLLREQNIHDDGLHLDNVVYITKETNDAKPGSQVQPKDILVNITGASIGRNSLVPDDFDTANVNQHVLIVRLVEREVRFYIHECLRSPLMLNLMYGKQTGDKPGLSAEKVMAFPLPLPPLAEQKAIVARVEELLNLVEGLK